MLRVCTACKLGLEATEENFYKSPRCLYGLAAQCKSCQKKKAKEYRDKPENKRRMLDTNRAWRSKRPKKSKKQARDLVGLLSGNLTVLERAPMRKKKEAPRWVCQCSCGEILTQWASSLIKGSVTRCKACGIKAKRKPRIKTIEIKGVIHKKCSKCKKIIPLVEFDLRADPRTYLGKRPAAECKLCRAKRSRTSLLKKKYGLTVEDFDTMLNKQNGACALCKTTTPGGNNNQWHVDHCHTTGKIRGILCSSCNTKLGHYEAIKKYDPEDYLKGEKYGLPLSVGKWSASLSCVQ